MSKKMIEFRWLGLISYKMFNLGIEHNKNIKTLKNMMEKKNYKIC